MGVSLSAEVMGQGDSLRIWVIKIRYTLPPAGPAPQHPQRGKPKGPTVGQFWACRPDSELPPRRGMPAPRRLVFGAEETECDFQWLVNTLASTTGGAVLEAVDVQYCGNREFEDWKKKKGVGGGAGRR